MKTNISINLLLLITSILNFSVCKAQCHVNDWKALKALYESTDGDNWTNSTGWGTILVDQSSLPEDCLTGLFGLELDQNGRVFKVDLDDNRLTGQIPVEISNLTFLRTLVLTNNFLNEFIPTELSNLNSLKYLHLSNNNLSGSIPAELSNLSNLIGLHLIGNNLTGSIPPVLANLPNLEALRLAKNSLTGAIPTEFGNFSSLIELDLSGNDLSGTIPVALSTLSNLNKLVLTGNALTGSIPKELANLTELDILKVTFNDLSGCLEPDLQKLCTQLSESLIDNGNNLAATWDSFCTTCTGSCVSDNVMALYNIENPIEFQITNAAIVGKIIKEDNQTITPIQFDLTIDSAGLDISGDGLCFSLHLFDSREQINLQKVYLPLSIEELDITENDGRIDICINRVNDGAAKKGQAPPAIASRSSIIQYGMCIVSDNLKYDPGLGAIGISGYNKVGCDEVANFTPATLLFGYVSDGGNQASLSENESDLTLQLNHTNCHKSGFLKIEILNAQTMTTLPYTYTLKSISGSFINTVTSINTINQFFNLKEDTYELAIKDSNNKDVNIGSKRFNIDVVGEYDGSICCVENLVIPHGVVSGSFNSNGTINFSEGTLIADGIFEICQ